jgi:AraC-like DNA-binding protein
MKAKSFLLEQERHGTPLLPLGIHRLYYEKGMDVFFYLHWHSEIEFFVVTKGVAVYTIEDQEYIVHENEGVFVNANALHTARSYEGMECECCAIVFQPTLLIDNVNLLAYAKYIYPVLVGNRILCDKFGTKEEWQKEVVSRIVGICALGDEKLGREELWARSELLKIWNLCYHHPKKKISEEASERRSYKLKRMEPVMDYIHEHYNEEMSLKELAELIPMSEGQFCRSFKEIMNMPPIAYVVRFRILRSCMMLENTDDKIGDIAREVGFSNISYFNREFLRVIGCSPGTYRKNQWAYLNS